MLPNKKKIDMPPASLGCRSIAWRTSKARGASERESQSQSVGASEQVNTHLAAHLDVIRQTNLPPEVQRPVPSHRQQHDRHVPRVSVLDQRRRQVKLRKGVCLPLQKVQKRVHARERQGEEPRDRRRLHLELHGLRGGLLARLDGLKLDGVLVQARGDAVPRARTAPSLRALRATQGRPTGQERERERDRVSEQLAADRQVTNTHQGFFVVGQKNEEDARSPFCCVALHTTAWRTLGVRIDASIFTGIVYSSPRGRSVGAVLPRMKLNEIKYDNVLHGERRG